MTRCLGRVLPLRGIARASLMRATLRNEISRPNDVTVVLGVRNRCDYRLTNALRSIRAQAYPADRVQINVVDYGSTPRVGRKVIEVCEYHGARYLRVNDAPVWSRSHCLNIGIKLAETKFLLTSDVDIVFSPNYLAEAVHLLAESPASVVYSAMRDLPEESAEKLERAADTGENLQFHDWAERCNPRYGRDFHPSIGMTYTALFQLIRGYDEYYKVWGFEDDDLFRRFRYMGLKPRTMGMNSFYLHQWHLKLEGVLDQEDVLQIQKNRVYFGKHHSILRNDRNWGQARPLS
ncbi:MAG: glycosyltransferase [Pseudomonadota bacterium]